MIDIQPGDLLVVGAVEYPVKSAAAWAGSARTTAFQRLAKTAASTKRKTTSGTKILPASTYLTGLLISPLDPVSAELASTAGLDTPHALRQCFLADADGLLHLIVEDLKR